MNDMTLARRYSRALFQVTEGKRSVTPALVYEQLSKIQEMIGLNGQVKSMLRNPHIPLERKKSALRGILESCLKDCSPVVLNFMDLLILKKRIDLLPSIVRKFAQVTEESKGILKAYVRSAAALSEKTQKEIEKGLSHLLGGKVIIETSVCPELLAGISVNIGDRVIDNSLRTRMKILRSRLKG